MAAFADDSGLIVGEEYRLEYSRRRGSWILRHPTDRRLAWVDSSLLSLVEKATETPIVYRYDLFGHDSRAFQPCSHSFDGVLLAVAGHPREFNIPPELEGDYSAAELDLIRRWQSLLVAGTASAEQPPVDAQSLSFKEALELISQAPSRGTEAAADDGRGGDKETDGEPDGGGADDGDGDKR